MRQQSLLDLVQTAGALAESVCFSSKMACAGHATPVVALLILPQQILGPGACLWLLFWSSSWCNSVALARDALCSCRHS